MSFSIDEKLNAKDEWLKLVRKHRRKLSGLPRVGFNPNAGNVEHNIEMINKMISPTEMVSTNPVSGPFGGDVSASTGGGMAESLHEDVSENKLKQAVGILYDMDSFILEVTDNMTWLSMGVPDGEFEEASREDAEINWEDHEWLITVDDESTPAKEFYEFTDLFTRLTRNPDMYDPTRRSEILSEAADIMMLLESYDKLGNPERCPECDALLNDSGECPRCVHGEEFLTEGILDKIQSLFNRNSDAVKVNQDALKKREIELQNYIKNLSTLIAPSYKDTRYTFYRNGEWVDYDTWTAEAPANQFMDNVKNITRIEPDSAAGKVLEAAINVVVRDNDGYVIRRGLENTKFAYNPADPRMLRIPAEYRADQLIGIELKTPVKEPINSSPSAEEEEVAEQTNTPEQIVKAEQTVDTKLPTWLKPETIKAATTLLAKRKDPTVIFYTGDGKAIEGRAINMDNVANVYTDKKLKKPFIDVLKEIKDSMVKRKAAVAKSAALFGESLDDDIQIIECDEMTDLDEGLTTAELRDVLELAKAIGIETVEGMEKFSKQEVEPGESILDALKRYRDDLGDDFELIESSPAPLCEDFVTKDMLFARIANNEMRAGIEAVLNSAAANLDVPEEELVIFEDKNLDYDPVYYADGSKQITRTMYKFDIAFTHVIEARVAGTILLIFKSKDDADAYIQTVSCENI